MGEYWTNSKGDQLAKLGTVDDWRYISHREGEIIAPQDAGLNTDVPRSLREPSTLWRFPWPDEAGEHADPGKIGQRSMGRTLTFSPPRELVRSLKHGARVVHFSANNGEEGGGGYGVNVWVPCLASPEPYPFKTSPVGSLPCNIYGERWDERGPRTIFRCAYCGEPFSLSGDELAAFRVAIMDQAPRKDWVHDPEGVEHARRFAWFEAIADALRPALSVPDQVTA